MRLAAVVRPYACLPVSAGRRVEHDRTVAARGGRQTSKFVGDAVRQAAPPSSTNRDGISSNVCGDGNR
jgi:hypothetical protein